MEPTTTIRTELENFMKQNWLNITQFGLVAGINPGTISGIVTGNRALSIHQLDRITATLGHSKGHFYKNYIEEFLSSTTPNIRRVRPLLYNCAELDMLDCIEQVVSLLMEKLAYADALFSLAEDLFQQGKFAASIILYESVAVGEKKQHSERLALCQYRIFMAKQGDDQEINYQAAIHFEDYVERLDDADQLDALKDLANTYLASRQWNKLDKCAHQLEDKSKIQYRLAYHQERKKKRNPKKPSRPLFYYLSYSNLLHAIVCQERKDYEQALKYIHTYGDVSWVKENSQEAKRWMQLFQEWAVANSYANKLLSGDTSVIYDYLAYSKSDKDELPITLCNIVEAANQYNINISDILQDFELEITQYIQQQPESIYIPQKVFDQLVLFLHELAKYYLVNEDYTRGFNYLIICLEKSATINNETFIIKCVGLFEGFKWHVTTETETAYQNIIKKVCEKK
ncbi:transcriptional regulator [Paenibacillus terrae]|uniref:Transcriptional regulator n=1 Tax=Paenibacillus terrae TaxID=159743 RepID=A0A4U2Q3U3_9BACL|nr:transcriptional regulator [Paenibacillus terrae]TKH45880.1 transcriptional regulator [Paenibacillus terrae]